MPLGYYVGAWLGAGGCYTLSNSTPADAKMNKNTVTELVSELLDLSELEPEMVRCTIGGVKIEVPAGSGILWVATPRCVCLEGEVDGDS